MFLRQLAGAWGGVPEHRSTHSTGHWEPPLRPHISTHRKQVSSLNTQKENKKWSGLGIWTKSNGH